MCANCGEVRGCVLESDADAAANGSERGNARDSDFVAIEPASEEWGGDGEREREACLNGQKRTRSGGGALQGGDLRLLEDGGERGGTLVSDVVGRETAATGGMGGNGETV